MVDNSPSQFLSDAGFVTHIFRMSLFFFIAGFFGRLLYHKLGARGFWANRGAAHRRTAGRRLGGPVSDDRGRLVRRASPRSLAATPPAPCRRCPGAGAFPLAHLWFLYQLLLLYVAVTAVRALVVRLRRARRNLRCLVDAHGPQSLRLRIAVFTLGIPGGGRADVAADVVLLDGHSDARQFADSAAAGQRRLRHGVRLRLAGEPRRAMRSPAIDERLACSISCSRLSLTAWLHAHHARHAHGRSPG